MKNTVKQDVAAMMGPQRTAPKSVPKRVTETIRVRKTVQILLPLPASGSAIVSAVAITAGIPGGLTYWRDMRIAHIDVFSNSSSVGTDTLTVTVAGDAAWGQTPSQYVDSGVYGQRRAHVGFQLGLLQQARWFNVADDTPLCAVSTDAGESVAIVQVTLELQSNFTV